MRRGLGLVVFLSGLFGGIALVVSCGGMITSHAGVDGGGNGPGSNPDGATGNPTCGGSCTVSGPIDVKGPVKVITADTDSNQFVTGYVNSPAVTTSISKMVVGPAVLNELSAGVDANLYIVAGADCPSGVPFTASDLQFSGAVHGVRYLVPKGSVACVIYSQTWVRWSGFIPYQ